MFVKIGTTELLVILCFAVLIFGPKKLPQLGRAIGQTIGNFKRSSKKAEEEETPEEKEA